ncbi:MAG: hypothetical protein EZS28_050527, partial [Streblomastix strix]
SYGSKLKTHHAEKESGFTETQLRKMIVRFGTVWASNLQENLFKIYYGWETNADTSLVSYLSLYREGTNNLQMLSEVYSTWPMIYAVRVYVEPPASCTSTETYRFGCQCTQSYSPEKCICPNSAQGLRYIPKSRCGCIANDLRGECAPVACTSDSIPAQGCICSQTFHPNGCWCSEYAEDLVGIDRGQCKCILGDQRELCPFTSCTSGTLPTQGCICASQYHPDDCTCPEETEQLVGVPIGQCTCRDNDPRSECNPKPDCAHPTTVTSTSDCPCLAEDDPRVGCEQKPDCAHPTTGISKDVCPCLAEDDPRVGCETKPNCARPTSTTLTSDCPCLASGDPRSACDIDDPC